MSRARKHHAGSDADQSLQTLAEQYLAQLGLTFDFDAGRESYDYRVAIGNAGVNLLVGDERRDNLWGLDGPDRLAGGAQDDVLYGDAGADILVGGPGADRLTGGADDDALYGGVDEDALRGGDGADWLDEGVGHGDLEGGRGADTLVGGPGPDAFAVDRESGDDVIRDFTAGPGMFDHLALRNLRWEDLAFTETSAGVRVSWAGGSVLLEGVSQAALAQDDFMFAEAPDLPPSARPAAAPTPERPSPMSSEGPELSGVLPGTDFDVFADAALRKNDLRLDFAGDERYSVAVGARGADTLIGTDAGDHLFGRDGRDRLLGQGGDDVLQGDAGNDELLAGDGMDRLDGGSGNDRLFGGAMADEVMGMEGRDFLDGGAGHDMIEAGRGDDLVRGGTGADAFIVDPQSGFDLVLDFEAKGPAQGAFDHLALRDIGPEQVSVVDGLIGALVQWSTDADAQAEGGVLLAGVYRADLRQSDFMFFDAPGFVAGVSDYGSQYVFDGL